LGACALKRQKQLVSLILKNPNNEFFEFPMGVQSLTKKKEAKQHRIVGIQMFGQHEKQSNYICRGDSREGVGIPEIGNSTG